MIVIDKKALKTACLLVFLLFVAPVLAGCEPKNTTIDNWEKQVLYARECGMDGLPCCADKDKPCLYGQQCCRDPNDPDRNMCANECACGEAGAFCCGQEEQCHEGLACFAGYCAECGDISDPCCDEDEKCQGDLACHQDICVVCGIPGNPCCLAGIACINQEKRDSNRTECRSGLCVFCGHNGAIACQQEPFCAPGHLANNGFCLNCGGLNQPCCDSASNAGQACNDDAFACELGFCTRK